MKSLRMICLTFLLTSALAGTASAQWCGENGLIRFSFVEGDEIVPVATIEPTNGVTIVDVWAWLDQVEPMARQGEAFLATGGFEFELVVDGAEAIVVEKTIPIHHLDMGKSNESCIVGLDPGLSLRGDQVQLVKWKVMFQGEVDDVVFRLKDEVPASCHTVEGCDSCGSPALYIGVEGSNQLTCFFGAGYEPAYLNPTGEVDPTPVRGTCSFADVGVFERR